LGFYVGLDRDLFGLAWNGPGLGWVWGVLEDGMAGWVELGWGVLALRAVRLHSLGFGMVDWRT
jgi:hypothetical protein